MQITTAESAVLDALWRLGASDADEITADLAGTAAWSGATVRTLLQRLIAKKAARREKGEGGRLIFTAVLERADYAHAESKDLIDRLFGGRFGPLAAQFAEREKLTPEDLAELKAIIARIEDGR